MSTTESLEAENSLQNQLPLVEEIFGQIKGFPKKPEIYGFIWHRRIIGGTPFELMTVEIQGPNSDFLAAGLRMTIKDHEPEPWRAIRVGNSTVLYWFLRLFTSSYTTAFALGVEDQKSRRSLVYHINRFSSQTGGFLKLRVDLPYDAAEGEYNLTFILNPHPGQEPYVIHDTALKRGFLNDEEVAEDR